MSVLLKDPCEFHLLKNFIYVHIVNQRKLSHTLFYMSKIIKINLVNDVDDSEKLLFWKKMQTKILQNQSTLETEIICSNKIYDNSLYN